MVWVGYVVRLAVAHSRFLGWDVIEKRFPESTWVIYSQEITYHAPAFEGEELTEETWVSFVKGARCIRQTSIYSKDLLLSAKPRGFGLTEQQGVRGEYLLNCQLELLRLRFNLV